MRWTASISWKPCWAKQKRAVRHWWEQGGALSLVKDNWKYIEPTDGAAYLTLTGIETGNSLQPQLYDLTNDIGEKNNLAEKYPEKVKELAARSKKTKDKSLTPTQ